MNRVSLASLAAVLLSATGCAQVYPTTASDRIDSAIREPAGGEKSGADMGHTRSGRITAAGSAKSVRQESVVPAPGQGNPERKIVYTASVDLVVENFDGMDQRIRHTVDRHDGYLARSDLDRMQGQQRRGRWTARIPVDRYTEFLNAVSMLGVPTAQTQNAEDVTEEYVDLAARIANKRKLESRIIELLDRPDDEIKHVIEVERELARVREEIERMEGRIRFLTDQTTMTTVQIAVREERDYQPPQAPSLGNRVAFAWTSSLERISQFFQNTIVLLAGNLLFLLTWAIGLVAAWWGVRSLWRKLRGHSDPGGEYEY